MTKETKNGNLNFHASVPTYKQPVILEQYVDDDGELNFVLDNGRTTLASKYNSLWLPVRGVINMQSKWKGIDGRTNWIK